jgi:WD40 repeat protein
MDGQILCIPALGLAQLAIEKHVITPAELPSDNVRFPIELLSPTVPASIKVSRQEVARFIAHREGVTCLELGPGSLATAGRDNLIRLWDSTNLREIRTFAGHTDVISGIVPLWEQAKLVSVSWDSTVRVWDLHTGEEVGRKNQEEELAAPELETIVRVPSRDIFLMGYGQKLVVWDLNQIGRWKQTLLQRTNVFAVDVSPNGERALVATEEGVLLHVALEKMTLLRRMEGSEGPLYAALFHPEGPLAFSAGADGFARLWDLQSARCVRRFEGHFGPVRCLACTPDGKWLVSCGDDETIRVWDVDRGTEATRLEGHRGIVRCVRVLDGSRLISGGDDGTVRTWDVSNLFGRER